MRIKKGTVVSAKNDKTAVVLVHTRKMHPLMRKAYRSSKKYHAHDENNQCKEGDEVIISETKPISKLKRWNVDKVTVKANEEILKIQEDQKIIQESKPDYHTASTESNSTNNKTPEETTIDLNTSINNTTVNSDTSTQEDQSNFELK